MDLKLVLMTSLMDGRCMWEKEGRSVTPKGFGSW